ncbi:hypothetical protein JZY91_02005 [Corynebacterium sp. CNCTC7651]|uniref:hypothetical protein n=1 Tax=Corynebacterium sp. CNCTC7651 TaxID=2815361 RepID=UPI001F27E4DB|nr:hypothetical protein [Corynebacterium sp. CNCTC7651]UIZ92598.1 hypothetical protein JZY91_02005 [Corynebacterium sp. CNCTC7651]
MGDNHLPEHPVAGAIRNIQGANPLAPVTVLCGPEALDDITSAVATGGAFANVEVSPLRAFVEDAARVLGREPLTLDDVRSEVSAFLAPDAAPTVFHDKHLNESPATLEGLTDSAPWTAACSARKRTQVSALRSTR